MEPDIREALADIRTSVRDGFKDVQGRIDQLVTKGEFEATIQRLDAQHATLRRDFDSHETASALHIQEVRSADAAVEEKARAASEAIRTELHKELEGFRTTSRWALTLAAAGAATLVSLISWLLSL